MLVGLERPVNDGLDISQPLWGRVADPVFRSRQIRALIVCLYPELVKWVAKNSCRFYPWECGVRYRSNASNVSQNTSCPLKHKRFQV